MNSAEVWFSREHEMVVMTLMVHGHVVARSASQESITSELRLREMRFLTIEDDFSMALPTSEQTLLQAIDVEFTEPMAALKLIAACASFGEIANFPYPERRAKRRAPDASDTEYVAA